MTEAEKRGQEQKTEIESAAKEWLFALLRYETCGTEIPISLKKSLSNVQVLSALYNMSKAHDLTHLIADAIFKNKLLDKRSREGKAFFIQMETAVFRYEQMDYELQSICGVLEEKKIPHMPLKGSLIRALYPEPWMRTSCDIDIYVQESELDAAASAIVEKLGYRNDGKGSHDMQMYAPSGVHLELHYNLIEDSVYLTFKKDILKVWENALPTREGGFTYKMTDENTYFYHIVHAAKHFSNGGCGIRPFIDLWYMEKSLPYDREQVAKLLEESGLAKFEKAAKKLVAVWLESEEHDELSREMETFVITGGVYGVIDNTVTVRVSKGRFSYFLDRVFPSYQKLKDRYLILRKYPILYPFYIVRRWFNLLFVKDSAKNSLHEWRVVKEKTKEKDKKSRMGSLLKDLGLSEQDVK